MVDVASILNILSQVQETTVNIGKLDGHYISQHQVIAIIGFLRDSGVNTPTRSEDLGAQLADVERDLSELITQLAFAPKDKKPELNLEIGRLQSRKAAIKRVVKLVEDESKR